LVSALLGTALGTSTWNPSPAYASGVSAEIVLHPVSILFDYNTSTWSLGSPYENEPVCSWQSFYQTTFTQQCSYSGGGSFPGCPTSGLPPAGGSGQLTGTISFSAWP